MVAIASIVENTLIPHSAFEKASKRLAQCLRHADGSSEPICLAIVGESRTGKSRVLEECAAENAPARQPDGLNVPILYVKTPSKPTVKSLAELMLKGLQDPRFDAGTENAKTIRLRTLMRNAGTRMVMIDDFQHFYDKGSHKVMHHVADWLKILVDDSKVALTVAGLPTCQAVLEQNEQLAGRFLSPVFMPRFDWAKEADREEFVGILGAFQESLSEHFDMVPLDTPDMAFRCYCGTGGLMGYLTKFLRQAVWNALEDGRKTITLADLALAHDQTVWSRESLSSVLAPFSRQVQLSPTPELLTRIHRIGLPAPEIIRPRNRRTQPIMPEVSQQLLCAS